MSLTLILVIIGAFNAFLVSIIFASLYFKYRNAINILNSFFIPENEGSETPFAITIKSIAEIFSAEIAQKMRYTFMGMESGAKRQEAAVTQAIVEDSINQESPLIGQLLGNFPTLKKKVLKNPALLGAGLEMLSKLGQNTNTGPGISNNGKTESYQARLLKYE